MAGAHLKQHLINSVDNHSPGTNGTLLGSESGALAEKAFGTPATGGNIVQRVANGNVVLPGLGTPAVTTQAISVEQAEQLVGAAIQGLTPKGRVEVGNVIDDGLVTAPGGPATGDSYIVAGIGGLWSGFAIGDLVTWDGAAWQLVLANAAGVPPNGTRVVVTGYGSGAGAGSFAGQDNALATYTTGSGWSFEAPGDAWHVVIGGENEPFENSGWLYDITPAGWVMNSTGTTAHNATSGIQGGTVTERYHLTQAEQLRSLNHKADFALAGTEPAAADFTTGGLTGNGDWAFAYGTGGLRFHLARVNAVNVAVELTVIT